MQRLGVGQFWERDWGMLVKRGVESANINEMLYFVSQTVMRSAGFSGLTFKQSRAKIKYVWRQI